MSNDNSQAYLQAYISDQGLAENMIPLVGQMYRNRGVIVTVFGRKLMNASVIDIIKAHRSGRNTVGQIPTLTDTSAVLAAMQAMNLGASRVDIGKLANRFTNSGNASLQHYIAAQLAAVNNKGKNILPQPQDVVLYGFGRIGRILARMLIERTTASNKMRLRAIVVRGGGDDDLEKRASLLRRDSIHGPFNGSITVEHENSAIIANGNYIKVIFADQPEDIDYTRYGIENVLVVDNTGIFKDQPALSRHLESKGCSKVLLTAPAGGKIKNIVYGVNQAMIGKQQIICAASCTTNAITPVLKAIHDRYQIQSGHIETIHSYTNDQNLIDNYHQADRRGRSAPLNMVLTSTGAANAVAKAVPALAGKLTANAIRVPTPNVSMAVMNLNLAEQCSSQQINDYMRQISIDSALSEQIAYSASAQVVSSDIVGTPQPAVFDSVATIAQGNRCVLYVWYDNEYGYSTQVVRVMRHMIGLHIPSLPA